VGSPWRRIKILRPIAELAPQYGQRALSIPLLYFFVVFPNPDSRQAIVEVVKDNLRFVV